MVGSRIVPTVHVVNPSKTTFTIITDSVMYRIRKTTADERGGWIESDVLGYWGVWKDPHRVKCRPTDDDAMWFNTINQIYETTSKAEALITVNHLRKLEQQQDQDRIAENARRREFGWQVVAEDGKVKEGL